ncbi:MAG: opioid growth factor receptor-related protein [Isosphaeraceae bacterium]
MSPLLRYHAGQGTDGAGRTLAEVQAMDHRRMEYYHDFIQWTFPLRQASVFNPDAPVLTDDDVRAFQERPELRENLRRSFIAFLNFLGLTYDVDQGRVIEAVGGPRRSIFSIPNHNWLRITRVLLCLRTLGLDDECAAFFACLKRLHEEGVGVTEHTFAYWEAAAEGLAR